MANKTNYFLNTNWREKVAAMTATNDQDIEKAFSDQASGFVENAVGDLMKDQHRVGFEVVKKNDNNTRMVGIFAFRVADTLIYAPVFFLNGEIKGPLLYRSNTKTFVPANKEWANYLIESMEMNEGKGRDMTRRSDSAPLVRMHDIAFLPPGMGKRASNEKKECACSECCSCCSGQVKEINVPSKQKKLGTPDTEATGEYEVSGIDPKKKGQPELNTGESVLKVAHWEDGTVRIETAKGWVPMTQEDGYEIKRASEQGYSRIVAGAVEHTLDKEAAARVEAFIKETSDRSARTLEECLNKIASFMDESGAIKELLTEPDFGKPAAEAIVKAAEYYEFANMLAGIYGSPKNFMPERFTFTPQEKAASVNPGELAMYYDFEELTKAAGYKETEGTEFFKSGAVLHDTRTGPLSIVVDSSPDMLVAPDTPGVYSILKSDGTFMENAFVAYAYNGPFGQQATSDTACKCWVRGSRLYPSYEDSKRTYVVFHDGKILFTNSLLGAQTKDASKADILKDYPVSKKVYYIYIPSSETVMGPIAIKEVKNVGGVRHCRAYYHSWYYDYSKTLWTDGGTHPLIVNPELETSDLSRAVFGKDAKFIEVDVKRDSNRNRDMWEDGEFSVKQIEGIGSTESLDNWIYSTWNVPKVKIETFVEDGKTAFVVRAKGNPTRPLHRNAALIKLAHNLNIPGDKAYELVERAEKEGKVEFYLEGLEKEASRLWLADRPNLDDEFSSEFGIPLVPEKKFVLRVQGDQIQEQPSSIGDVMNPTSPTGLPNLTVATTDPEELQHLADTYHLPNVFEHGVIGTLADTFNAVHLIDKYIGKIEDAVDSLGRIKFLIYWCPSDFEKAYGTDDMANFEAEIDANFEELGALLMKLLKKSENQKKSNGSKQEEEKAQ